MQHLTRLTRQDLNGRGTAYLENIAMSPQHGISDCQHNIVSDQARKHSRIFSDGTNPERFIPIEVPLKQMTLAVEFRS